MNLFVKGQSLLRRLNTSLFNYPSIFTRWELSFFQILKAFPDPVMVTDTTGKIYYVNPAWEKFTGYSSDEVRGKNPRFLKSDKTDPQVYKAIWKNLTHGKSFSSEEIINKKKNNRLYQTHSTFFPILEDDHQTFYVQVQHDITKRKMSEQMKTETLRLVSHELKTPITVLKLLTSRFAREDNSGYVTQRDFDLVDRQIDILTHLIENMLDVSRIETGKLTITAQPVNLTELVRQNIRKTNLLLKRPALVLEAETKLMVEGDAYRLDQVVTNLFGNALKFSPPDSTIIVRVRKKVRRAVVSVTDTGKGIAKSNLRKIFMKYYQVNKGQGMGLGLAISKEIITKHKGTIWVTSRLHKGSTFYFSLPLIG